MKRPVARKIPFRNRSPYGWWIASYLERFEYHGEDRRKVDRRCIAWENTVLIKARDREQAWRKAMALGRVGDGNEASHAETGRRGTWHFEGLTHLLPVHERLEDGAEVIWVDHTGRSVRTVCDLVKRKGELEAFDDRADARRSRR